VAPFIGGDSRQPAMDREPNAVTTADPGTRAYDRDVWQTLLYHHDKIRREVKRLPNGLAAVTESDDPSRHGHPTCWTAWSRTWMLSDTTPRAESS
jgi:hypothetical protein